MSDEIEKVDCGGLPIILTVFYKRVELTTLCFEELKRQSELFGLNVVAVGSEGDSSSALAESFGFHYVEAENNPLGKKFNAGSLAILDEYENFSGIIVIGSDDFVKDELFEKFRSIDGLNKALYGPTRMVYYSSTTLRSSVVPLNQTWGAGRLYTFGVVDALDGKLWSDKINKGLDTYAMSRCMNAGAEVIGFDDLIVMDVKHELNITSPKIVDAGRFMKEAELLALFPIIETIKKLTSSKEDKQIRMKKNKSRRAMVRVKYLKDAAGVKKGTEKTIRWRIASALKKEGIVSILTEFGKTAEKKSGSKKAAASGDNVTDLSKGKATPKTVGEIDKGDGADEATPGADDDVNTDDDCGCDGKTIDDFTVAQIKTRLEERKITIPQGVTLKAALYDLMCGK